MMTDYSANTSSTQTENVSRETSMDASRSEYTTAPALLFGGRGTSKDLDEPELLLRGADTADGGAAVGAFALRDGLAVLRRALDGVLHDLLGLALHAIRFYSDGVQTPFCSLLNRAQRPRENARDSRNLTSNTRPPLYGTAMQAHRGCRPPLYILQQLHNEFRIVVQRLLVDVLENIVPLREERRFRTIHAGEVHSLEALLDCN